MQKYFICTDGKQIDIAECLKKCRLPERCLTLATLQRVGLVREWQGVPSTTQCLKGTYQAMLEITQDYAVDPKEEMWKILGTSIHSGLELDISEALIEKDFGYLVGKETGVSGIPDILECENEQNILTDYKICGSYKVMIALGYDWEHKESSELYQKKTTIKLKNGESEIRNKGDKKLVKVFMPGVKPPDIRDWVLQLNHYKLLIEENGFDVHKMNVQAIVRDGGLQIASSRGIHDQVYTINIPIVDRKDIVEFFSKKCADLKQALIDLTFEQCTDEETWSGRRCQQYCPVSEFCKYTN